MFNSYQGLNKIKLCKKHILSLYFYREKYEINRYIYCYKAAMPKTLTYLGINLHTEEYSFIQYKLDMLLTLLLIVPLIGIFLISTSYNNNSILNLKQVKVIALSASIVNLFISMIVFILFNFSSNQFQFVQEYHSISSFDFYLGVDGISIYFVLLTTIIMPISLLSN